MFRPRRRAGVIPRENNSGFSGAIRRSGSGEGVGRSHGVLATRTGGFFRRSQGASPGGAFSPERLKSRLFAFRLRADTACRVPGRFACVGLGECFRECWGRVPPFLGPGAIAIATPVAAAAALRTGNVFFLVALSP